MASKRVELPMSHITITPTDWQWKQVKGGISESYIPLDKEKALIPSGGLLGDRKSLSEWHPCSQFPTEIHLELLNAGLIPHPYKGGNEHLIQWVGLKEWQFSASVRLDQSQIDDLTRRGYTAELELESLDTFATVFWNDEEILKTSNHFLSHKLLIPTSSIMPENALRLHFFPAEPIAKALEAEHGAAIAGSCNLGEPSRVYVRKMQACFRWDWGPELMTMGPDRPIRLHLFKNKFKEVVTRALVDETLERSLEVEFGLQGDGETQDLEISSKLLDAEGKVLKEGSGTPSTSVQWDLGRSVDLWWPNGSGEPVLYTFSAELRDQSGVVLDTITRRIGFRRIRLVQDPLIDQPGTTFLFEVNNKRIFSGGSNWIPTDQILPMIPESRYRGLLKMAADGNQNMIRAWGGGVYEPDLFYDICDELGLMVWQDFQFACGVYPVFQEFLRSVKEEAICNVKRLRHHASLTVFCGGNENHQQVRQWKIDESLPDPLPCQRILDGLLPEVVSNLVGDLIPYWTDSPKKVPGSWQTDDPTQGDIHQWLIWAGEKPWQDYDILGGRFISEFGMPSIPSLETVKWWLDGDEKEAYPQSRMMQQHNKAGSHERRFAVYMNELMRFTDDLETYIHRTQIMQSEALGHAYRSWRREWRGRGKEYTAGALVWQLNDSWPVTSWSIIDYFLRPKPAYFTIKRALELVSVGTLRTVKKNRKDDRPRQFYEFGAFQTREVTLDIWGCNSTSDEIPVTVSIQAYDIATGRQFQTSSQRGILAANSSTELLTKLPIQHLLDEQATAASAQTYTVVVHVQILDGNGHVLARASDWPQPYKFLDFPDPGYKATIQGNYLRIAVVKPAKGVIISSDDAQGDRLEFDDNGMDMFPGDEQLIKVEGDLLGKTFRIASMGHEKGRDLIVT